MKASELIKDLNELIKQYGDLPVELHCACSDPHNLNEIEEMSYTIYGKYSNKPDKKCFTLLDFVQSFDFENEIGKQKNTKRNS